MNSTPLDYIKANRLAREAQLTPDAAKRFLMRLQSEKTQYFWMVNCCEYRAGNQGYALVLMPDGTWEKSALRNIDLLHKSYMLQVGRIKRMAEKAACV